MFLWRPSVHDLFLRLAVRTPIQTIFPFVHTVRSPANFVDQKSELLTVALHVFRRFDCAILPPPLLLKVFPTLYILAPANVV